VLRKNSRSFGTAYSVPESVILLKQNQTFAGPSMPLRCNVRGLVKNLLSVDGFFWMGNLGSNRFPELKQLRRPYPSELETRVGHKELHRSSAQKLNKVSLVKVPDTLPD
jgi:hypothetical protein